VVQNPEIRARVPRTLNTPADVHYDLAAGKAAQRSATLAAARARHPERFNTDRDPLILTMPDTAWINRPAPKNQQETDTKLAA
jgi:putative transposase